MVSSTRPWDRNSLPRQARRFNDPSTLHRFSTTAVQPHSLLVKPVTALSLFFSETDFPPIHTGFLTKQKPSPTRIREGEKTVRNLSFCRINNKESHPRHTRQPNNTKHESAAQPLARKADLTCTAAECEIKCDRQF